MTGHELQALVEQCTYKPGWTLLFNSDDRPYVQWEVEGLDSISKQPTRWRSGKRYLSSFMCRQEVVAAVFSLALAAEEHEAREWFRYKGASIYNPHLDPDVLAQVAKKAESFNVRADAMMPS